MIHANKYVVWVCYKKKLIKNKTSKFNSFFEFIFREKR